jgi:hypothetical protein
MNPYSGHGQQPLTPHAAPQQAALAPGHPGSAQQVWPTAPTGPARRASVPLLAVGGVLALAGIGALYITINNINRNFKVMGFDAAMVAVACLLPALGAALAVKGLRKPTFLALAAAGLALAAAWIPSGVAFKNGLALTELQTQAWKHCDPPKSGDDLEKCYALEKRILREHGAWPINMPTAIIKHCHVSKLREDFAERVTACTEVCRKIDDNAGKDWQQAQERCDAMTKTWK